MGYVALSYGRIGKTTNGGASEKGDSETRRPGDGETPEAMRQMNYLFTSAIIRLNQKYDVP
ncbi:MAG: hypothetical protein ABIL14_03160 [candidate division WOR-3 bacterium]